jgi:hypothetical protein
MCTVTFIASGKKIYITSNRDEKVTREKALPPAVYKLGNGLTLYPKDAKAGGTWIVAKDNGDAAVLLNGAFIPHVSNSPYKKSRGLVLLEVIQDVNPHACFKAYDCNGIEPFTMIVYSNGQLYEYRWDGIEKYIRRLLTNVPYIWSSATLYSTEIINKRRQWFENWLKTTPAITRDAILQFHRFAGDGNMTHNLMMEKENETRTVSITQIIIEKSSISMHYWDALDDKTYLNKLIINTKELAK